MNYQNILSGLMHGAAGAVLMVIPIVIMQGVGWQDITVGAILNMVYQWAVAYSRA